MKRSLRALALLAAAAGCGSSGSTAEPDAGAVVSPGDGAAPLADATAATADATAATAGDATADAGTDGSMSSPPAPVATCTGLAGSVGHWQNISPPAFTSLPNLEVVTVVVSPTDGTVYASAGNVTNGGACPSGMTCPSEGTGVFKSTDCGATWARVSDTTAGTDSANLLTGDAWAMLLDPVNPQILYLANGYGNGPTIYKSTDGAVHWTALNPDPAHALSTGLPFVQAIAMDPFDHTHLAVTFHETCASPFTPWCFSESNDSGATWHEFNGPTSVPGFTISGWMESASISILGPTSYLALSPGGVYFSGDAGTTWTLVVAEIDDSVYSGGTHILPDGTLVIGDSANVLYESAPAPGHAPPFALYQAPSLPVPMPRLPFETALSPAATQLTGSPPAVLVTDDGVNLYASTNDRTGQPFWTAPLSNPKAWTKMPDSTCIGTVCRGSDELAYDPANHIVYSANLGSGLWRLVTR